MPKEICPKESVYNWVSMVPETENEKPPRYVSKFTPAVVLESKLNKHAMKTMGPEEVELPRPDKFLQKGSTKPKQPEKADFSEKTRHTHLCTVRKPAVPKRTEQPLMGMQAKRDFKETHVAVTTKPEPRQVVSKRGHLEPLEKSGLVPKYIWKKDYGKAPVYLQRRREAQQRAQEHCRLEEEERKRNTIQCLQDEEREALLQTLKEQWNANMEKYQKLPFIIGNLSQISYKNLLEKTMDELEKKVKFLERYKTIYILN